MATSEETDAAFKELQDAAIAFKAAIQKFKGIVPVSSVGLDEWCESIDETLFDIDEELE